MDPAIVDGVLPVTLLSSADDVLGCWIATVAPAPTEKLCQLTTAFWLDWAMFRRFWLGCEMATAPAAMAPPVGRLWASDTLVELKQAIAAANTAMPVWRDVDVALVAGDEGFISLASTGKFRVGGAMPQVHGGWGRSVPCSGRSFLRQQLNLGCSES